MLSRFQWLRELKGGGGRGAPEADEGWICAGLASVPRDEGSGIAEIKDRQLAGIGASSAPSRPSLRFHLLELLQGDER